MGIEMIVEANNLTIPINKLERIISTLMALDYNEDDIKFYSDGFRIGYWKPMPNQHQLIINDIEPIDQWETEDLDCGDLFFYIWERSTEPTPKVSYVRCKICNEPFKQNEYEFCSYKCATGG